MSSGEDIQNNTNIVVKALSGFDGDILFLPENSLYFNCSGQPRAADVYFDKDHPSILQLSELCLAKSCTLHLGGVPWKLTNRAPEGSSLDPPVVENRSVVIDAKGSVWPVYGKAHLFDLHLENLKLQESASFSRGSHLATLEINGWRLGSSICYDLRFAEMFSFYRHHCGVSVLLVPSAFTVYTGRCHWETLLKSRAVENQCFVVAPNQCGEHLSQDGSHSVKTWGQSLVFDPWGRKIMEAPSFDTKDLSSSQNPPILLCRLDYESLMKVRQSMPMEQHRAFHWELKCSSGDNSSPVLHYLLP